MLYVQPTTQLRKEYVLEEVADKFKKSPNELFCGTGIRGHENANKSHKILQLFFSKTFVKEDEQNKIDFRSQNTFSCFSDAQT